MRFAFFIIGFCFLNASFLTGQELQDTVIINKFIKKSGEFRQASDFEKSVENLQKALDYYEENDLNFPEKKIKLLTLNGGLALDVGNYDSALEYFQTANDLSLKSFPKTDPAVIRTYLDVGIANYYLANYDIALLNYEYAENLILKTPGENDNLLSSCLNNIGICYYIKMNYKKALDYYKKALDLGLKIHGDEHLSIAQMYNNIGICYKRLYDYNQAIIYHNKSLTVKLLNVPENHPNLVPTYNNMGASYVELGKPELALEYYYKGAEILLENFGQKHPRLAPLYANIGNTNTKIGEYAVALDYLKKSLEINREITSDFYPEVGNNYGHIGDCLTEQRKFSEAVSWYNKARNYYYQKRHEYPAKIGEYYLKIAGCRKKMKDFDKAFENYDLALKAVQYSDLDFQYLNRHFAPHSLMRILSEKANTLVEYYTQIGDIQLLQSAQKLFDEAIKVLGYLKSSVRESGSKQILLDNFFNTYEGAIAVCHQLHQISGDEKYLHEAFKYAEQSNGILLQEAVQKTRAEQYSNIPDSLLNAEQDLKIEIAWLESQRFNENQKGNAANQEKINNWNDLIFDLKSQYDDLMQRFESEFPEYFELRYASKTVPVGEIQKDILEPNDAFIEYFVGDDHIFVFIITRDSFLMEYIPKVFPLEAWVEELRNAVITYSPLREDIRYLNQKYVNIAYELYELVFKPVKSHVNEKSLIIVPGGILGYLPFEALLSELPEKPENYKSHAYLINDFSISYNYSAFLLKEEYRNKNQSYAGNFLGVAPLFESALAAKPAGSRIYELGALKYNIPEVESIQNLLGGTLLTDTAATEENFRKIAKDYRILHLATHGKANDQSSDYSFLAFYEIKDNIENELLYVKDLYNLDLQADMVVLSACETGIGELQRGEGIISLARGFFYAGVRSIITTLWSIDDKPTAEIMEEFYLNLKKNQTKDEALRNAKLYYIENQSGDMKTHPRYWAGFVPVGNRDTLNFDKAGIVGWWIYLLAGVAVISGIFFFRSKNRDS